MSLSKQQSYKYCIVPKCNSTTISTPDKVFIVVPEDVSRRKQWFKVMRRGEQLSSKTRAYCCEDHFNIETDIENYMKYKMGFSQKLRVTDGCLPSKFDCQPGHKIPGLVPYERKRRRNGKVNTVQKEYQVHDKSIVEFCTENNVACAVKSSTSVTKPPRASESPEPIYTYIFSRDTIPCSEETLTEHTNNMIYNVFDYMKKTFKDNLGNPLAKTRVIELTSNATGVSRETITQIVCDREKYERDIKEELDIGPTELYKPPSSTCIQAQEMPAGTPEFIVKQEPELQEDVSSLDSPETKKIKLEQDNCKGNREADAEMSDRTSELIVKQEPELRQDVTTLDSSKAQQEDDEDTNECSVKQEIDIGPSVLYKPSS